MNILSSLVLVVIVAATYCSAIPKDRRVDPDLSDLEHNKDGEHNPEYDHEAFLGKDEAKTFDDLTPEESKRRLGIIVDKIDADHDGSVTKEELKKWIEDVQRRYIVSDSEKTWKDHDKEDGDKLTWHSYRKRTYGMDKDEESDDANAHYKDMVVRDKRRWEKADADNDGYLTLVEFTNFLHPEEVSHMKDLVVLETLDDIDKDKDGKISLEEYIGDLVSNDDDDDDEKDDDDDDEEDKEEKADDQKEWIADEKKEFADTHDKDKDGYLDTDEVKAWIMPDDNDHPSDEADHLFNEADADKDGKLTKEEIVEKYDVFAGSQATDFGDILQQHDEF